jgi:hypothetical protein
LREFQRNNSGDSEYYGALPYVDDRTTKTEMMISVPIGDSNHERPIEEVERVVEDMADDLEEYFPSD